MLTSKAWAEDEISAYDPFVDYSEYQDDEKEKDDINFFRNGRFISFGFLIGLNQFTDKLVDYTEAGSSVGMSLSFFFDLRFSMELSYQNSEHALAIKTNQGDTAEGSFGLEALSLHLKYHLNTQNLTRGLAFINPYVLIGFSRITRTIDLQTSSELGKNSASGVEAGAGIEIPLFKNKMYLGMQAMYHVISFPDENVEQPVNNVTSTGVFLAGDMISYTAIIGINF